MLIKVEARQRLKISAALPVLPDCLLVHQQDVCDAGRHRGAARIDRQGHRRLTAARQCDV